MGILEKHIDKEIRYQEEDIIIFEPTREAIEDIKEELLNQGKVGIEKKTENELLIYVFNKLTNIGHEITDLGSDNIAELIYYRGDRALKNVCDELNVIINEIVREMAMAENIKINALRNLLEGMENERETKAIQEEYQSLISGRD